MTPALRARIEKLSALHVGDFNAGFRALTLRDVLTDWILVRNAMTPEDAREQADNAIRHMAEQMP